MHQFSVPRQLSCDTTSSKASSTIDGPRHTILVESTCRVSDGRVSLSNPSHWYAQRYLCIRSTLGVLPSGTSHESTAHPYVTPPFIPLSPSASLLTACRSVPPNPVPSVTTSSIFAPPPVHGHFPIAPFLGCILVVIHDAVARRFARSQRSHPPIVTSL